MPSLSFLQMSDLHLDSSLQAGRLGLSPEKARLRRNELRQIVPKACVLVRERKLQAVFLPGDLFDDEAVTQDTVNFVIDHLAGLSPVPVFIAPGNHDFYSLGSPYNNELLAARKQRLWPDNVHIFRDGRWSSRAFPSLPHLQVTGMAHSANAALADRLLARPVPRPREGDPASRISVLMLHGSRDNTRLPPRKLRTLPFSDAELLAQGFDYAAIGHYHHQTSLCAPDGRTLGAYAGCPAGRGLDEEGERVVLVGEIVKEGSACRVSLDKVRLDGRAVRCVDVSLPSGSAAPTHREAILKRIEQALAVRDLSPDDLVHIRLIGRVAPGIDARIPEGLFEERYFHVSFDLSLLKPDYNLDRYRDGRLKTTEARFAREMLRRIDGEPDPHARRLLENALYYGLDALVQKQVSPRYED